MATQTPNAGLTLVGIGESAGTWGIPINNNFSKIDIAIGEIISARGSEADVNSRFGTIESEISIARGVHPSLNDRLSVMLYQDGNIDMTRFPKAGVGAFGAVKLSTSPVDVLNPIVVGNNDSRLLTSAQRAELVSGGLSNLHKHNLVDGAADVTATAGEINQALDGISQNITAANLNFLFEGNVIPKDTFTVPAAGYNFDGIVSLSVTPADVAKPIAVGTNDTRLLSDEQKEGLVLGNVTNLHKHNLVDGAADVTVTAAQLNQLTGIQSTVTASNLGQLTDGSTTALHDHDGRYFTKTETESKFTDAANYTDTRVQNHNTDDSAHAGGNLNLGNITAESVTTSVAGPTVTVRSDVTDGAGTTKLQVVDPSGVSKIKLTSDGVIHADKIVTRLHETVETTSLKQDAIITSDLTVNGSVVLGDDNLTDTLVVNTANATFNSAVSIAQGLTVAGSINGVDVASTSADATATKSEVQSARSGEATLSARIAKVVADSQVYADNSANTAATSKADAAQAAAITAANTYTDTTSQTKADAAEVSAVASAKAYTDTEVATAQSTAITTSNTYADNAVSAHNTDNNAHLNANLTLGDITVASISSATAGKHVSLKADNADVAGTVKFEVQDKTGLPVATIDSEGTLTVEKLVTKVNEVLETTTLSQDAVATSNLSVNGNTTLGDNNVSDVLVVNTVTSTFNGDVIVAPGSGITVDAVNGVDPAAVDTKLSAVEAEVVAGRNGKASIKEEIDSISDSQTNTHNELVAARGTKSTLKQRIDEVESKGAAFEARTDNPNSVTITQAIASDIGTDVTVAELESLTDGSSADSLHTHAKYDIELAASRESAIKGSFTSLDLRLANTDTWINDIGVELTNARNSESTLDARLDKMDTALVTYKGTNDNRSDAIELEISEARKGKGLLKAKIDEMDILIAEKAKLSSSEETSAASHTVANTYGSKAVFVQVLDTATGVVLREADITSITVTDAEITVVLPSARAVTINIIG